jgi:hypothetical protein
LRVDRLLAAVATASKAVAGATVLAVLAECDVGAEASANFANVGYYDHYTMNDLDSD